MPRNEKKNLSYPATLPDRREPPSPTSVRAGTLFSAQTGSTCLILQAQSGANWAKVRSGGLLAAARSFSASKPARRGKCVIRTAFFAEPGKTPLGQIEI
jgi:hypothetical protein